MSKFHRDSEAITTEDEQMLVEAKRQIDRCVQSMDEAERFDPQLSRAFNGLLKTTQEIAQRTKTYKRTHFAEFFNDMRQFFREHNPAVADAIEAESEAYLTYIGSRL